MRKQHSPHREETLPPHSRDNGRLWDNQHPHTLPHLTPGSPAALPIPLADRGEQRPPGEQAKVAAVNNSGNCHDRSRQRGIGGAASGQKKPPPATPKPLERTLCECERSVDRQRSHSDHTKPTSKRDDPRTQRLYR